MAKIKIKVNPNYKHYRPRGTSHHAFRKVYWPYIPVVLVMSFMLSFGSQNGMLRAAINNPTGKVLAYASQMSVSGLLSTTNNARADNSVAALSLNGKLNAAAQAKAEDMANRNYWSHNTPEGNPPWIFPEGQGYSYLKLGENLAAGFSSEQTTINGWMASSGHKANMLDSEFAEVGFGYANNADYTSAGGGPMTIVVAFYGKPTGTAQPASPPPASPPPASQPAPQVQNISGSAPSSPTTPAPSSNSQPAPAAEPKKETPPESNKQPDPTQTTTENPTTPSQPISTSRADISFANLPFGKVLSATVGIGLFIAAGFWLMRHSLRFRRALRHGEHFIMAHPVYDFGLLIVAVLSFVLSKTAGFVI